MTYLSSLLYLKDEYTKSSSQLDTKTTSGTLNYQAWYVTSTDSIAIAMAK